MKTEHVSDSCKTTLGIIVLPIVFAVNVLQTPLLYGVPANVRFVQSARTVDAYDFVEVTLEVDKQDAGNPLTDVVVDGRFAREGGPQVRVDGFYDSSDGRFA